MSDMQATVTETKEGFSVKGYEVLNYDFEFIDGVFNPENKSLADCYTKWGRVLAVMDSNIYDLYGDKIEEYFEHHKLDLSIHKTMIGEKAKSIETLLSIVDSMNKFGIIRKEPVLTIGGGLVTDVAGFACAAYRRNTNFIRIPTTVIGLIDASVSIKVGVNYGQYKNRLGAYHAPMKTFLDFTFLKTLPVAQIRNGFAELIKISTCAHLETFELLEKYAKQIIETAFGRKDGAPQEVRDACDRINRNGIHEMLKLETPNLHEIGLDRVIAYGHTWSPLHELIPDPPLRHGHAISVDMAYSATLANMKGMTSDEDLKRIHGIFASIGLSMDHPDFTEDTLEKATAAILKTRDGKLRAAMPSPLGSCKFLNDVSHDDMCAALRKHKELMKNYPREGMGLEAFVDASDTGYTKTGDLPEKKGNKKANSSKVLNDDAVEEQKKGGLNDEPINGVGGEENKKNAMQHAGGSEGVNGHQGATQNGMGKGGR